MRSEIKQVYEIVKTVNPRKDQWSFLTSIEYMIESDLYMDSLFQDAETVSKYINREKINLLDFGTGSGIFSLILRMLNKNVKISAIDTLDNKSQPDPSFKDTPDQQKLIYEKFSDIFDVNFSHYDGLKLPYSDKTFDIITAYAVIEHIDPKDLDSALKEIKRVLKPDGHLFIFKLPRKWGLQEYIADFLGFGRHDILYGDKEAKKLIEKYSFNILFDKKSEMVFEFPGKLTNKLYYVLKFLNSILYHSPLRIFAHHNNFILKQKT